MADGTPALDGGFASALQRMMADAPGAVSVASGGRSSAAQQALWDASDKTGKLVAKPGTSWHEKGLAADLRFASPTVLAWAHQHAADYGLFFPMSYEPWHVQPLWTSGRSSSSTEASSGLVGDQTAVDPTQQDQGDPVGRVTGHFLSMLTAPYDNELNHPPINAGEPNQTTATEGEPAPAAATSSGSSNQVDRILATIRQRESGGNYKANNTRGGARGAYQFIDSTWKGLGGTAFAPNAALATPAQQDQIARKYVESILAAHGGDLAAVPATWYVGHYDPSHLDYVPAPQAGNTLTVKAYSDQWMQAYQQTGGSTRGGR